MDEMRVALPDFMHEEIRDSSTWESIYVPFRHRWRYSKEYRELRAKSLKYLAAYTGVMYILIVLTIAAYFRFDFNLDTLALIAATIFLFAASGSAVVLMSANDRRIKAQGEFQDRIEAENRQDSDEEASPITFEGIWKETQKRMAVYHDIATDQSKKSFFVGRLAAFAGFAAVFGLGVMSVFFANNGSAAIAASIIGVAGAGMSGYVGATFMKTQADASAQLRQFFLQPVETARLLSLERLVSDLDSDRKVEVIIEVVRTTSPHRRSGDDA